MSTTHSDTDTNISYGSYLALDELLSLQRPRATPEHPDELLFIVVHQASELWFKCMLHEIVRHQAAHYGSLIRARYGEPFFTTETMRVDDITTLEVATF